MIYAYFILIIYIQLAFFPLDTLSHSAFFPLDILSHSAFFPFDVWSHSMFCPIRCFVFRRFVIRRFLLTAFFTSTFCRWTSRRGTPCTLVIGSLSSGAIAPNAYHFQGGGGVFLHTPAFWQICTLGRLHGTSVLAVNTLASGVLHWPP